MAIFGGLFGGNNQPQDARQFQRFTPEQQQALSQVLQLGLGGLQQGSGGFEPIAQQARTQFQQQTIPSIAQRFTAMNGQRSGAFQQALGQAGAGLEEGLASLGSQYNLQRQGQLQNLLGAGLTPQFDTYLPQEQQGFGQTLLESAGTVLPLMLGGAFGGGLGGGIGSLLKGGLSQLLGGLLPSPSGSVGRQVKEGVNVDGQQDTQKMLRVILGLLASSGVLGGSSGGTGSQTQNIQGLSNRLGNTQAIQAL